MGEGREARAGGEECRTVKSEGYAAGEGDSGSNGLYMETSDEDVWSYETVGTWFTVTASHFRRRVTRVEQYMTYLLARLPVLRRQPLGVWQGENRRVVSQARTLLKIIM
jgi:hypothetical protein